MLEQLRQNSRSFIIWIIFGIIILAFVFTFGSQGGLQFEGCAGGGSSFVMRVKDRDVSEHSWRFGRNTLGSVLRQQGATEEQVNQTILDRLLAREILASAATSEGFRVTADLVVAEYLAKGKFFTLGEENDLLDKFRLQFTNAGTGFMKARFDNSVSPPERVWVLDEQMLEAQAQGWGLPNTDMFIAEQKREVLAELMRRTLRAGVVASPQEAKLLFEQENTKAKVRAVVFRAFDYREKLAYTDADVAEYLARHEQEVRARYDENERLYKERKPQIRMRQMVFDKPEEAKPEAAEPEAGEPADAAKPEEARPEAGPSGRAAADAAYQRLQAGADFAQLAAEVSEDERTRRKGGDLGWRSAELPGLSAPALSDAAKSLAPGQYSEVIEVGDKFYILFVQEKREGGDLSFDQVKLEIATPMMLEAYANELARRDAQTALDKVKAGQKLDELFEAAPDQPAPNLPPGLTPELLQQLSPEDREMLLQQLMNRQGSVTVETRAVPAQSGAAEAVDASGAPADAAGNAAAPADAGAPIARPEDVPAPKLQTVGPFARDVDGEIRGIGTSAELMGAVFDQLEVGQVSDRVYEVDGKFVIVELLERTTPNPEDFTEATKAELMERIAGERASEVLNDWLEERCRSLAGSGKVTINNNRLEELIGTTDTPFQYRACQYLR